MTEPHFHGQAGVRIAGTGLGLPEGRLTNADLEKIMDTSDEWIVQRTGIRERRKADPDHESQVSMATKALDAALADAGMKGSLRPMWARRQPGRLIWWPLVLRLCTPSMLPTRWCGVVEPRQWVSSGASFSPG